MLFLAAAAAAARDGVVAHWAHAGDAISAPVISDPNRRVLSRFAYSRWRRSASARPVFIIDPYKKVRLTSTYPEAVGRDFSEILRIIDSLRAVHEPLLFGGAGSYRFAPARLWPKSAYHQSTVARNSHPAPRADDASVTRQDPLRGLFSAHDGKPLST